LAALCTDRAALAFGMEWSLCNLYGRWVSIGRDRSCVAVFNPVCM